VVLSEQEDEQIMQHGKELYNKNQQTH